MRIRDKHGITAMVDAMIFVIIMGIAISALCIDQTEDPGPAADAAEMMDHILAAEFELSDMMDTEDSSDTSMTDLLAASMINKNTKPMDYLEKVLDDATATGEYRLTLSYGNQTYTIGSDRQDAVSGCVSETPVTFGGVLRTELYLF